MHVLWEGGDEMVTKQSEARMELKLRLHTQALCAIDRRVDELTDAEVARIATEEAAISVGVDYCPENRRGIEL
jgi:hypothetical protein